MRGMQGGRRCLHADDGEVGGGVRADDRRRVRRAVTEADANCGRALDDVVIGRDVTLLVEDEPGAERADLVFPGAVKGVAGTLCVMVSVITTTRESSFL